MTDKDLEQKMKANPNNAEYYRANHVCKMFNFENEVLEYQYREAVQRGVNVD
jgi:type I site-specific restriction endonuclease